jgi:hypothetical protein
MLMVMTIIFISIMTRVFYRHVAQLSRQAAVQGLPQMLTLVGLPRSKERYYLHDSKMHSKSERDMLEYQAWITSRPWLKH